MQEKKTNKRSENKGSAQKSVQQRAALKESAKKIADLRKSEGLSRAELADLLCVTVASVSHWENARVEPAAEIYIKLGNIALKSGTDFLWFWGKAGLDSSAIKHLVPSLSKERQAAKVNISQVEVIAAFPNPFVSVPVLKETTYVHSPHFAPADQIEMYLDLPRQFVPVGPVEISCLRLPSHLIPARLDLQWQPTHEKEIEECGDVILLDGSQRELRHLLGTTVVVEFKPAGKSRLAEGIHVGVLQSELSLLNETWTAKLHLLNIPHDVIPVAIGVHRKSHPEANNPRHVMWKEDAQFRVLGRLIGWFAGERKFHKSR